MDEVVGKILPALFGSKQADLHDPLMTHDPLGTIIHLIPELYSNLHTSFKVGGVFTLKGCN